MLTEEYEIIGKIKEIDFGETFLASKKGCNIRRNKKCYSKNTRTKSFEYNKNDRF